MSKVFSDENFPHSGVGSNQAELYIRDLYFLNYHINHDKWNVIKMHDVIDAHRFVDDFCCGEVSGCWSITTTEEGQGSAAEACANLAGGVLTLTNAAADNDSDELQQDCECWKLVNGYPAYFEIRFKVSDGLQSDVWFGLATGTGGWFVGVDDYVVFRKDDGDRNIDFVTCADSVETEVDTGQDLADLTWTRLGFHWDGEDTVRWFVIQDGDAPQTVLATGKVTTNICQDEEMAIGFGIRNGEAVAKVMYIDYVKGAQKRVIE